MLELGGRDLSTINSDEVLDSGAGQVFFPGRNSEGTVYSKVFGLRKTF